MDKSFEQMASKCVVWLDSLVDSDNEEVSNLAWEILCGLADLRELLSMDATDGGPGSGAWGHEGRPGHVGGGRSGGKVNRGKDKRKKRKAGLVKEN